MSEPEVDVDQGFARLEQIVALLEKGGVTLGESMSLYQEGMALVKACAQRLEDMNSQVMVLQEQQGAIIQRPLDEGDNDLE